jgi:bla regulator protein blaR1
MRLRKRLFLFSLASLVIAILRAQTSGGPDWQTAAGGKMAFEVASVKLAKPGTFTLAGAMASFRWLDRGDSKPPGGHFSASFSLGQYIFFAYKLEGFQIGGMLAQLPKWAGDDYAINAEAEGNPTKDQIRLMMQSLLADRFKLKLHFETKEVPVLALTLVNPGKLGPKLLPHSEGPPCPDSFEMDKPFTPMPPPKPGVAWPPQCGTTAQMGTGEGTWLGSRNTTMGLLASAIWNPQFGLDQPVVDQTGLEGRFDFILELPGGMISLGPKPPNPDDPPPEPIVRKALREQLGLKLVRSRGEVRTLIIDHVERPSEN